jgi:aquaporin Z
MAKLLTEVIGTFFLVLTIGLTAGTAAPLAAIAIGSALMIMVYMGGHISGAHYNPAVTLAVVMRGKLATKDALGYWGAQLVGAILAALAVFLTTGLTFAPAPNEMATLLDALIVEFLYTFALALVVLNVATADATAGNSYYGLAIGFTVLVGAIAAGPISGGAFNPAVGVGPILIDTLVGGGTIMNIWIYLVGPLLGGACAALVFRVQHGGK